MARLGRLTEIVRPLLEPAVAEVHVMEAANLSLAISMKRIADEICGTTERYGLCQNIGDTIERSIINATRR